MHRKLIVRFTLPCVATLLAALLPAGALAQQLVPPSILPGTIGRLAPLEPAQGELDRDSGQNFKDGSRVQLWTFDGTEGQHVAVTVRSNDFDTFLTLFAPSGDLVEWNDDAWHEASDYWYSSSLEASLPETGRYMAVVSGYSSHDMGSYEIVLGTGEPKPAVRRLADAMPLAVPGQASGVLEAGMPPAGEGFAGPGRIYSFSLDGDYLTVIRAWSAEVDTVIVLYDADGVLIDLNDDAWSITLPEHGEQRWTDSALTSFLTAGDYYLVVGMYSDWEPPGEYGVSVRTFIETP